MGDPSIDGQGDEVVLSFTRDRAKLAQLSEKLGCLR
jgi:hypothetical protein